MEKKENVIDISAIIRILWPKKKLFVKVCFSTLIITYICILPEPRYYRSEVSIAPESDDVEMAGGLASLASNFGLNIGAGNSDAIYPQLYPDLMNSTEFVVGLFDVQITTLKGDVTTDYYTYLLKHQKLNYLMMPYYKTMDWLKTLTEKPDIVAPAAGGKRFDPFHLSRNTMEMVETVRGCINCIYNRKTSVVTVKVKDQDPLVCALLADSIKAHLQDYIIEYRTKKARLDLAHYQQMRDSAELEYDKAMQTYSRYCDAHQNIILQSFQSERDKLENELSIKQNVLTTMETQLQATKVKLQERTPAFTTLTNATVPVKPAGPKRLYISVFMMIMSFFVLSSWLLLKKDL